MKKKRKQINVDGSIKWYVFVSNPIGCIVHIVHLMIDQFSGHQTQFHHMCIIMIRSEYFHIWLLHSVFDRFIVTLLLSESTCISCISKFGCVNLLVYWVTEHLLLCKQLNNNLCIVSYLLGYNSIRKINVNHTQFHLNAKVKHPQFDPIICVWLHKTTFEFIHSLNKPTLFVGQSYWITNLLSTITHSDELCGIQWKTVSNLFSLTQHISLGL